MTPPKVTLADLRAGELEISERSEEKRQYKCGHEGPASFDFSLYELRKTLRQGEMCPDCVRQFTCDHLVRCPHCEEVYEIFRERSGVTISSLRHFEKCFAKNFVKELP